MLHVVNSLLFWWEFQAQESNDDQKGKRWLELKLTTW